MEVEMGMEPGGGISCLLDDASKKIRKPYTITKSRESWTDQEHEKFLEALQLFTFLLFCVDDTSRKIHKLYTMTKSRESWTKQEHDKFLEALQLFDRDWKKIEAFVGSKTVIQIRSHAQKYFLKVQKNGSGEHVPPPRPKRKSSQPYPQKAAKSTLITHQAPGVVTPPSSQQESLYPLSAQPCTVFIPPVSAPAGVSAWVHHMMPMGNAPIIANGVPVSEFTLGTLPGRDCISSHMGAAHGHVPLPMVPIDHGNPETVLQATPDFAEVYGFIGSVFDPNVTGHLRKLKEMAPIDRETVLLLMRNLSINLSSPDFEEHKLFLQVYDVCTIDMKPATESGTEDQTTASCLVSHSDVVDDADSAGEGEVADMDSLDTSQQQVVYPQSPPAEFFPKRGCNTYDGGGAEKNPENNSVSSLPHSTNNGEENGNGNGNGNENGALGLSARGLRAPANDEEGIVDLWWS